MVNVSKEVIDRLKREKLDIEKEQKRIRKIEQEKERQEFLAGKKAASEWAKEAYYKELAHYKRQEGTDDGSLVGKLQSEYRTSKAWAQGWLEVVREVLAQVDEET
jgi:hypothetical protein